VGVAREIILLIATAAIEARGGAPSQGKKERAQNRLFNEEEAGRLQRQSLADKGKSQRKD